MEKICRSGEEKIGQPRGATFHDRHDQGREDEEEQEIPDVPQVAAGWRRREMQTVDAADIPERHDRLRQTGVERQVATGQVIAQHREGDARDGIDRTPGQVGQQKRPRPFFQQDGIPFLLTPEIGFHGEQIPRDDKKEGHGKRSHDPGKKRGRPCRHRGSRIRHGGLKRVKQHHAACAEEGNGREFSAQLGRNRPGLPAGDAGGIRRGGKSRRSAVGLPVGVVRAVVWGRLGRRMIGHGVFLRKDGVQYSFKTLCGKRRGS